MLQRFRASGATAHLIILQSYAKSLYAFEMPTIAVQGDAIYQSKMDMVI